MIACNHIMDAINSGGTLKITMVIKVVITVGMFSGGKEGLTKVD